MVVIELFDVVGFGDELDADDDAASDVDGDVIHWVMDEVG